eukprot:11208611-Lingulodinium_polyedra.AAC.1
MRRPVRSGLCPAAILPCRARATADPGALRPRAATAPWRRTAGMAALALGGLLDRRRARLGVAARPRAASPGAAP